MRTKFYDDMLWSVFPPASCWNYTFQSFPEGNLTSRNCCQTLTHIYTVAPNLPALLRQSDVAFLVLKNLFIRLWIVFPTGDQPFFTVSPSLFILFFPLVHVRLSVSLCLFLYLCQHCLTLYVINLAYNSIAFVIFHPGLVLFCISDCFTFPFLEFFPPCNPVKPPLPVHKSTIRDHT